MQASEVHEVISTYLSKVNEPGLEGCDLQEIKTISEYEGRTDVQTSVAVYVRIGAADVLLFPEEVTFSLAATGDGPSVSTAHEWEQSWERVWLPERASYVKSAHTRFTEMFGEFDPADLFHVSLLLLLVSDDIGPYPSLLAKLLEVPGDELQAIGSRFRAADIWTDHDVDSAKWYEHAGQLAMICDALVGTGELERRWSEADGKYQYRATELGTSRYRRGPKNRRRDLQQGIQEWIEPSI